MKQWAALKANTTSYYVENGIHIWPRPISIFNVWTRITLAMPMGTTDNFYTVKGIGYDAGNLTPNTNWKDVWRFRITKVNTIEFPSDGNTNIIPWLYAISIDTLSEAE